MIEISADTEGRHKQRSGMSTANRKRVSPHKPAWDASPAHKPAKNPPAAPTRARTQPSPAAKRSPVPANRALSPSKPKVTKAAAADTESPSRDAFGNPSLAPKLGNGRGKAGVVSVGVHAEGQQPIKSPARVSKPLGAANPPMKIQKECPAARQFLQKREEGFNNDLKPTSRYCPCGPCQSTL